MAKTKAEDRFCDCINCGEEIRMSAKVCPYCGTDQFEGGRGGGRYSSSFSVDDDDFDYDEFVRTQIHGKQPRLRIPVWVWAVAVVMLIVFVLGVLRSFHLF